MITAIYLVQNIIGAYVSPTKNRYFCIKALRPYKRTGIFVSKVNIVDTCIISRYLVVRY